MFPFVLVMLRQIPLLGDFIAQAEEMARGIRRKYRAQSQSRMGGRARQDADYYDYPPSFQPKPSPSPKYYSEF
jgi:formate hydrogenlyase subunit 4